MIFHTQDMDGASLKLGERSSFTGCLDRYCHWMSLKKQNIKAHLYPYTHNKKNYKISNRIYQHSRLTSISGLEIAFVKTTEAGNDAVGKIGLLRWRYSIIHVLGGSYYKFITLINDISYPGHGWSLAEIVSSFLLEIWSPNNPSHNVLK